MARIDYLFIFRSDGCDAGVHRHEMDTPDGYASTSWAAGYGDYVMKPDLATLRPVPAGRRGSPFRAPPPAPASPARPIA